MIPPAGPTAIDKAPLGMRIVTFIVIVVPFFGLVAAPFFLWGWGFSWVDLGLLIGMYLLTAFGITVGYHRLFTHRSFETYVAIKFIFGVLGAMAVQGSIMKWVAMHRRHHQHSDTPEDPHSPHHHGGGIIGMLRGAWHAHIGWFFHRDPDDLDRYVLDLQKSGAVRLASSLTLVWIALGLALPAALGGVISGSWVGVATGFIWGGLVRILLVHHVTWSVNSACHLWGSRFDGATDQSRDNLVFGILALGEGWHSTHHAFPNSARHGLRWWQMDLSYELIRFMQLLGLAWDVKLPALAPSTTPVVGVNSR